MAMRAVRGQTLAWKRTSERRLLPENRWRLANASRATTHDRPLTLPDQSIDPYIVRNILAKLQFGRLAHAQAMLWPFSHERFRAAHWPHMM